MGYSEEEVKSMKIIDLKAGIKSLATAYLVAGI